MLTRLAPLALVVFGACHTAPTRDCRLIGTWERRVAVPREAVATIQQDGDPVPVELLLATETFSVNGAWSKMVDSPTFGCPFGTFTVRRDGVVVREIDDPVQQSSAWRIRHEEPARIAVEIDDLHDGDKLVTRVFDVVDADHLTFRQNEIDYRMVRVKDAK